MIHVRSGGDVWQDMSEGRPVARDYPALPFSFYASVVRERQWRAITVVTQHPDDPMVQRLVTCFGARVCAGTAVNDFNRLRSARNIVLSVSTFAWWAAWLSDAQRIYYPVAGLFDPARARSRPWEWQQDLWVPDEPRYLYRLLPNMAGDWHGSLEDRLRLLQT